MQKTRSVSTHQSLDRMSLFFILFATFLGGVVRFYPALLSNWPLNDGGLFYRMTQDLLDHHFSLPFYASYNGNMIPFGYPPLAFYLMAFFQHFFHIDIISQLRLLPALISTLTIPAFYFLSKSITRSKINSVIAAFAFALMPSGFLWLIMGGGITRSLGVLFGILSLIFVWEMFQKQNMAYLVLSIFFCSLAILSHPELSWFLFLTSLLIGLTHGLNKKAILFAIFTIIGILCLTMIWWLVLTQRFGLSLFINALRTNGSFNPGTFLFYFTGDLFASLLAAIALFGLFAEIARKKFFILVWLVVISIFSPRSALMSNIPVAILFGSGFVWVLIPGLLSYAGQPSIEYPTISELFRQKISKIAFSVIMILAFFSALLLPLLGSTPVKALSQFDQQAMNWVSINTPSNSKFVVLTGGEWTTDYVSEWFPAISNRISVSTVQGSEWLPNYRYNDLISFYKEVQICAMEDFSCILSWGKDYGISYSYLYISKVKVGNIGINLPLAYSQAPSDHFQLVYQNPAAMIYRAVDNP